MATSPETGGGIAAPERPSLADAGADVAAPSSGDAGEQVVPSAEPDERGFRLALANFEGPFDLLLTLIARRELDITEVALSEVTDEFISYLAAMDSELDLDTVSEFVVVAATLLDLKIAGLLPQGELVDAEDVALLEARDLLFARLLQYRAFKVVSTWFRDRLDEEGGRHVRSVPLEDRHRRPERELVWTLGPDDLAALAVLALAPKAVPVVGVEHLHAPLVSIREQAGHVARVLREHGSATFGELVADAQGKGVVVARFLAVLELYRHAALVFEQSEPLGELVLTWSGDTWTDDRLVTLGSDYDR